MTAITRARAGAGIRFFYSANGLIPELVADFRRNKYKSDGDATTFSGLLTHSRTAGTATYVDNTGTLQTVTDGSPRLNHHVYEGGQWVNKGLLFESEARTNMLPSSSDLDDPSWVIPGAVTQDATGLDGLTTAWTISDSDAGVVRSLTKDIAIPADNNTHVGQFFIGKDANESRFIEVSFTVSGVSGESAAINTKTGEITGQRASGGTTEVFEFGDFWHVVQTNSNDGTGTNLRYQVTPAFNTDGSGSPDGSTTGSCVYAGGQVELNAATPSSYIPTSGSTVARAAETRSVASGKWPYSATAMSGYIEGAETYADENTVGQVTLMDARADANNRVTLTLDTDGAKTGTFTLTVVNGGTSASVSTTNEITPGILSDFKVAWTVTPTGLGIALNGTDATTANGTGIPDLSGTDVTFEGMGTHAQERMWGADISAAGRQEVTA